MKNYHFLLLLGLVTCLTPCIRAQKVPPLVGAANKGAVAGAGFGSVTGRVIDGQKPAEFTNVLLLTAADSQVYKLALAGASGRFDFRDLPAATYFIRTTGIGYGTQNHPVFALTTGDRLALPDYQISNSGTTLETVEVVARKPFLEQKVGMLVVNVDQSITGQGGSVVDLLKKVPGMVVAGNRIQLAGRSGLTILIDGRPTSYLDTQSLLRDMPADNIKSIEVISQPGAQYDAEGNGGVINIVLKKNNLLGTNGQVFVRYGYGKRARYGLGASLSHRVNKWNLTGEASFNRRSWVEGLDLVRRFPGQNYQQTNRDIGLPTSYALRTGLEYDPNDRQRLGLHVRYNRGKNIREANNATRVVNPQNGNFREAFTTKIDFMRPWSGLNIDAFYRIRLDTSGQEINFDLSYNRFTRDGRTTLRTNGDGDFPNRVNVEPSAAKIFSGQADYKKPLGNNLMLRAGTKVSTAALDNELRARFAQNGVLVRDRGLSNRFLYDEDIKAAYGSLNWEKGDLSANLGLRYEDTRTEGYNVTVDSFNRRNFRQLFPSAGISVPLGNTFGLSLAYSYRIERPSYYDLNPFVSYLDPLTFEKGNPFLRPELVHSGQVSLTYDKQPFFNLSYDYTSDVIANVTEQVVADEGGFTAGTAFQTTVNLDRYVRYGGSLFFPLDFIAKPISGYGGFMLYYNDYTTDFLGGQLEQDQWSFTGFLQINVRLPWAWKAEISGWYQGRGLEGIIRTNPLYGVDVGLEKDFFADRLRLQITGEGIVQRFFTGTIRYQEQNLDLVSRWEAPVFFVRLTYKFGNRFLKQRDGRESAAREERDRLEE